MCGFLFLVQKFPFFNVILLEFYVNVYFWILSGAIRRFFFLGVFSLVSYGS